MSNKNIQPWVKTALEMGPVILYLFFTQSLKITNIFSWVKHMKGLF